MVTTHSPGLIAAMLDRAQSADSDIGLFSVRREGPSTVVKQLQSFGLWQHEAIDLMRVEVHAGLDQRSRELAGVVRRALEGELVREEMRLDVGGDGSYGVPFSFGARRRPFACGNSGPGPYSTPGPRSASEVLTSIPRLTRSASMALAR